MKNGIKRIIMIFIIFLVTFLVIYIRIPTVYADFVGGIQDESGVEPGYTPDDSDPGDVDPSQPSSTSHEIVEYVTHYTGISGNVYEELGEYFSQYSVSQGSARGDIQNARLPIEGIIVEAGGQRTVTDSKGNYHFENLAPGNYTLKFTYGKIEQNAFATSVSNIRKILKYNGHDYITTKAPGGKEYKYKTTKEIEIRNSGRGCEQIILAIDCSGSVRNITTNINGTEVPRLKAIIDSTKRLVHSLLSSGENIYIGLVFFSGTCYRAQGLTNNEEILTKHLDYIYSNGWCIENTDLVSALKKADSSFIEVPGGSNRHVIVLSDGVPTADGIEADKTHKNDTTSQIYSKLDRIKAKTIEEIKSLRNKGINVKSIYLDPDDNEEREYINQIFSGNVDYFAVMQGDEFINEISENLKTELVESTEETEYKEQITVEEGVEDEARRKEVDNNYSKIFSYNNDRRSKAKLFEQIESEYTYNEQAAKELSNGTYMTVTGGTYAIDGSGGGLVETFIDHYDTEIDKDGKEISVPVYGKRIHVDAEYTGCDLVLAKRPALDLQLNISLTGEKLISKGMLLFEDRREMKSTVPIVRETDDELLNGATLDVEYTIEISNKSSLQCNYLEIITYLPKGFGLDENTRFITEDGTNKEYNWQRYEVSELKNNGYISEETYNQHKNQIAIVSRVQNDGTSNSFYIPSGGSRTIKVVLSSIVVNLNQFDDIDFKIDAEILGYADNGENVHRRMANSVAKLSSNGVSISSLNGLFPGNNKEHDYAVTTNDLYIRPPTGSGDKVPMVYIICIMCIVPLVIFETFVIMRKAVIKRKNRS